MKAIEIIHRRQVDWMELEQLVLQLQTKRTKLKSEQLRRFGVLYRNVCADLALAESYQLPPDTTVYLHDLVARSHNQLYRSKSFQYTEWLAQIIVETPRRVFSDPCVHLAMLLFWSLFGVSAWLSFDTKLWPEFAEMVVGIERLEAYEQMYQNVGGDRGFGTNAQMTGHYIFHNAGIGLACFVSMLFILPGLVTLSFNAVFLGAVFGYMFRPDMGVAGLNFQNFVTAHGPFELNAIILSAGAGLRIGHKWLATGGLTRVNALQQGGREALPAVMCAVLLFVMAALIEAFISPGASLLIPWWMKGLVAILSSTALMFYFVLLGYPWNRMVKPRLGGNR
jgi:uncharacterized membrane protein SpoIIM required for sporulation